MTFSGKTRSLEWKGWSPSGKLERCQGDCDSDSDCETGAKCVLNARPLGCTGTVNVEWHGSGWWWNWKLDIGDYCGDAAFMQPMLAHPFPSNDEAAMPVMDRPVFEFDISPMTAMIMLLVAVILMALTILVCCRSVSLRKGKKAVYKMVDLTDLESENEMEVRPMNRVK